MPNIDAKLTFGLELECTSLSPEASMLMAANGFTGHYDRTIKADDGSDLPNGPGGGTELITLPLTIGVKCQQDGRQMVIDYGQTERVVADFCSCAASVNKSCGVHIHLGRPGRSGGSEWEPERIRAFLAIGLALEEKLFGLVPASRAGNDFCRKISLLYTADELASYYPTGNVVPRKYSNVKRYCWLNLIEPRRAGSPGTVEIRLLGNVRRYEYIWAWVKLWTKIGAYVAYLPSALSILHCAYAGSIAREILEVATAKVRDNESREPVPVAPVQDVPTPTARGARPPVQAMRELAARRTPPRRRHPATTVAQDSEEIDRTVDSALDALQEML